MSLIQRVRARLAMELPKDTSEEATLEAPMCEPYEGGHAFPEHTVAEVEFEDDEGDDDRLDVLHVQSLPLVGFGRLLEKNGVKVKRVSGWKTRGRPGTFQVKGGMMHHTASQPRPGNDAPALSICIHGRGDLQGPLCQALLGRDNVVYLIAAGRANHAGSGGPWGAVPQDSGNAYFVGLECENNGVGESWSEEMRATAATFFAVLAKWKGFSPSMLIGHKNWTSRKIDPRGVNMWRFRRRVRRRMRTVRL